MTLMSEASNPVSHASPELILQKIFGHQAFRSPQRDIIQHLLAGGDALAVLPTGRGKSLCYQLPAVSLGGTAVIVSPLMALMDQQVSDLSARGIAAVALHSGRPYEAMLEDMRGLVQGRWTLVYVSPERLITESFLNALDQIPLSLIAIDEAHCVSEWGHDFRPEYRQLSRVLRRYPHVPRLVLTATATPRVREDIVDSLGLTHARAFVESVDRANLSLSILPKHNARDQVLRFVKAPKRHHEQPGAGLIYCRTRDQVERLTRHLAASGVDVWGYHAGMGIGHRQRAQEAFLTHHAPVMVATIAFGMGMDRPDVRYVVHMDAPRSLGAYVQETGRAGRDGALSDAWLTIGLADIERTLLSLRPEQTDTGRASPNAHLAEQAFLDVVQFAETSMCRRQALRVAFGEDQGDPCGTCDRCRSRLAWVDGREQAQMILSAVYRSGFQASSTHVVDVVMGRRTPLVEKWGHDSLNVFGRGRSWPKAAWRALLRRLIGDRYLRIEGDKRAVLCVQANARPLLRGEIEYNVPPPEPWI